MTETTLSYQTRIRLDDIHATILDECTSLFNQVERSLYAAIASGKPSSSCKSEYLKKYGITARQFNACRVSIEGKISSCKKSQELAITSLKDQIEGLNKKILQLEKKPSKRFILHQKKRRLHILSNRLRKLEKDFNEGRVRLCFGGKKLFKAQFYLEENNFSSHQEWQERWKAKRNSEFFVLGSKDETGGNQTCTAIIQDNGQLTLRLRLPNILVEKYGKYLEIKNISFSYGQEAIIAGLHEGQAISYRFKKDDISWRVFASTDLKKIPTISSEKNGVIGIDLNADHIACVETDRFGNLINRKVIPWISYGKSKGQLKASTSDLCKQIIDFAKATKKSIVLEKLDFKKKKMDLREKGNNKFSRLLSSFAYGLFFNLLTAKAFKNGIAVHQVNPAYTSVIGQINYATRYGLSIHLAAAFCIARRYQNFSETPCSPSGKIPDGKGTHLAFVLPARNRTKHVWHFWGQVKKKLSTVLAAHFRADTSLIPESKYSTHEIGNSRLLLE